jgi:hypothetical protein
MRLCRGIALAFALSAVLATAAFAQEAPPQGPFKAVHLVGLKSPAEVAQLQAALDEMNQAVAAAGFSNIRYRLYKVVGKQNGNYNYLWESSWPSGDVYTKVHKSDDWLAATKKHPEIDALMKDEIYNRYVEVMPAKK